MPFLVGNGPVRGYYKAAHDRFRRTRSTLPALDGWAPVGAVCRGRPHALDILFLDVAGEVTRSCFLAEAAAVRFNKAH